MEKIVKFFHLHCQGATSDLQRTPPKPEVRCELKRMKLKWIGLEQNISDKQKIFILVVDPLITQLHEKFHHTQSSQSSWKVKSSRPKVISPETKAMSPENYRYLHEENARYVVGERSPGNK